MRAVSFENAVENKSFLILKMDGDIIIAYNLWYRVGFY